MAKNATKRCIKNRSASLSLLCKSTRSALKSISSTVQVFLIPFCTFRKNWVFHWSQRKVKSRIQNHEALLLYLRGVNLSCPKSNSRGKLPLQQVIIGKPHKSLGFPMSRQAFFICVLLRIFTSNCNFRNSSRRSGTKIVSGFSPFFQQYIYILESLPIVGLSMNKFSDWDWSIKAPRSAAISMSDL